MAEISAAVQLAHGLETGEMIAGARLKRYRSTSLEKDAIGLDALVFNLPLLGDVDGQKTGVSSWISVWILGPELLIHLIAQVAARIPVPKNVYATIRVI